MTDFSVLSEDLEGRQIVPVLGNTAGDGSGTFLFLKLDANGNVVAVPGVPFEVRVTKNILIGGAYEANDVVSESVTGGTGTDWDFAGVASANGGYFVIDTATVISQTPNITPRFTLILFNAAPTGELDDNAVNDSPNEADLAKVLPPIDFPGLNPVGTSANSTVVASASTVGNLPLLLKCAAGSTTIYGIMTTLDIFTQTAGDNLTIVLAGRQF